MQESLFSSQWYRVAGLRPRLRPNVTSHRHYYRGAVWYIVSAKSARSRLRINAAAFHVFTRLDGERSVEAIWRSALEVLQEQAPSQEETMSLLSQLYDAGLIDVQRQSDVDQLFENLREKQLGRTQSRYWNPLFLRFALFDPDTLAQRLVPFSRWAFTRLAFRAWMLLVAVAAVAAAYSWPALAAQLDSNLVAPRNLVILWFVFPLMKLVHELAHAVAVKRWGGEVHEFGVALLVLLPVPYVDASDSASFGSKYRRMAVAGAGILVESTLASLALLLWLAVEPGLVRDVAFNVLLTGSVSSLLFNGNPLLKFDSYYVLSDLIEIPSLATRSNRYLLYLLKRYGFGMAEKSPVTARGERRWFVCYGVLAMVYRLVLTAGICLLVAGQYFFLGVALAVWALWMQIGLPIFRAVRFLAADPRLAERRLRAIGAAAGAGVLLFAVLFLLPMPNTTHARGVVWPVDEAMVRAGADCLVEEVFVDNDAVVQPGTALLRCDATLLEAEVSRLRAEQRAARAALYAADDRVDRGLKQSELDTASGLLVAAEADLARTTVSGRASGRFFAPGGSDLVGTFFEKGEVIGYLLDENNVAVRAMLDQERVMLLGDRLDRVQLRMHRAPERTAPSTVVRKVPAAMDRAVTAALTIEGGGSLPLHPEDESGTRLQQPAFELELVLPAQFSGSLVGEPVTVRFDHGRDPLASLIFRELRLLFLRRFHV